MFSPTSSAAVTQHALRSRVHEGRRALGVDAIDPLAGRLQDQLVFLLDLLEQALHTAPFGQTATHELVRLARRLLMVLMLDVAQRQQQGRTVACLHARGTAGHLAHPAIEGVTLEGITPAAALLEYRLGEHDQFGGLLTKQPARHQSVQVVTATTQKRPTFGVGGEQPIGERIDQRLGLRRMFEQIRRRQHGCVHAVAHQALLRNCVGNATQTRESRKCVALWIALGRVAILIFSAI